jgi:hypothetical protein
LRIGHKVSSYPAQKARRDAFYAIAQALMEHLPVVLNDPLFPAGELSRCSLSLGSRVAQARAATSKAD